MTDTITMTAGRRYLAEASRLVERLATDEWASLSAAAALVADALARGGSVHVFGTGHSHMLAEELFYRAGGLVRVRPILFEGLMLHAGAELSTSLERLPGVAAALLEQHPIDARRRARRRLQLGRQRRRPRDGEPRPARAGSRSSRSSAARTPRAGRHGPPGATNLQDVADVVIDNGGAPGDAAVAIDGFAAARRPDVHGRRRGRAQRDRRGGR